MKILNVNMSLASVNGGGTAERTFQMSRFLAKAGIECIVLTINLGLTPERIKALEGVKVIALPCLFKRFYIPVFSYRLIKRILTGVDVVHLMGHWTFINALVYLIVKHLNKPYVVCPAGSLPIYGRSTIIKRLYNLVIGKRIIRYANGHIAITADEIDQFKAYGVRVNQVSIIPNGINAEDFQATDIAAFRKKYGLSDHPFIMFMGRLNSIKGPDLLLRAFHNLKDELKDFHLVFVGPDGGMMVELEKILAEWGDRDRIHFVGYLGGADKSQAYYATELLVIPSRKEAMSIVVLEAGITRTPVLITDQCGINEIANFDAGEVVPASVDGLQKGLLEILKNPVKLKSMGENLHKYVCEYFSWNIIINKYLKLYNQILKIDN